MSIKSLNSGIPAHAVDVRLNIALVNIYVHINEPQAQLTDVSDFVIISNRSEIRGYSPIKQASQSSYADALIPELSAKDETLSC